MSYEFNFSDTRQKRIEDEREQMIQEAESISSDDILKIANADGDSDYYVSILNAHPNMIEEALLESCVRVSIIDEVQYLAEDI